MATGGSPETLAEKPKTESSKRSIPSLEETLDLLTWLQSVAPEGHRCVFFSEKRLDRPCRRPQEI